MATGLTYIRACAISVANVELGAAGEPEIRLEIGGDARFWLSPEEAAKLAADLLNAVEAQPEARA